MTYESRLRHTSVVSSAPLSDVGIAAPVHRPSGVSNSALPAAVTAAAGPIGQRASAAHQSVSGAVGPGNVAKTDPGVNKPAIGWDNICLGRGG